MGTCVAACTQINSKNTPPQKFEKTELQPRTSNWILRHGLLKHARNEIHLLSSRSPAAVVLRTRESMVHKKGAATEHINSLLFFALCGIAQTHTHTLARHRNDTEAALLLLWLPFIIHMAACCACALLLLCARAPARAGRWVHRNLTVPLFVDTHNSTKCVPHDTLLTIAAFTRVMMVHDYSALLCFCSRHRVVSALLCIY